MIAEVERDPVDAAAREDLRAAFEMEALHGRGPASLLYFGRDLETGTAVAVKVFPCAHDVGPRTAQEFRDSVAQAAGLRHSNIASPYRAGASERFFWCALPRIIGWSLADWLESDRRLELQPCLRLVEGVAAGLEHAHGEGVVHGDLKPSNVLLNVSPGAVVTDFWVPWVLETLGALAGGEGRVRRMEYVAPEERSGEWPSAAGDQYSLAALTCHCLWGRPGLPDPAPSRFHEVAETLERALSDTPNARFPNVRAFAAALRAATAAAPAPPRYSPIEPLSAVLPEPDPAPPPPDPRPSSRTVPPPPKRRWVAGVLALIVAVAGGIVAVVGSGGEPAAPDSASVGASPSPVPRESSPPAPMIAAPIVPAPPPPAPAADVPPRHAPVRASPGRPGRLFISSTPWGQAYVDDVLVGNTPQARVVVAAGTHRVRIVRDGFEPYEQSVRVGPGEDLRLTDIVLRAIAP